MPFSHQEKIQLIQFLNYKKVDYKEGWKNYMGTVSNPAAMVIQVENEKDLGAILQEVKKINAKKPIQDKVTIRAAGGWADKSSHSCSFFPWQKVQESEYNEGYSFSQVVGGKASADGPGTDIIIRFGKKFHSSKVLGRIENPTVVNPNTPIHKLPCYLVEVSAGVQIAALAEFLRKNNLSLTTVSMISWVTAVGLAGTAGHGTGRDEPAFSGLIESITVCDMDGNIREINRDHPDFAVLVGGHSGLLGIVLSIKLRAVQAFNLRETIDLFATTKEMAGKLDDILLNNQYVSFMAMPSGVNTSIARGINKWQVAKWNYTTDKPTETEKPTYSPSPQSLLQELEVRVGSSVMEYLVDSGLKHLLPYFMLLSASSVIGARGNKTRIDFENKITHPQVAFPKKMRDVSYLIPVKDAEAGRTLEKILAKIEQLVIAAAEVKECPITYSVYVRYLKGTNGGLSTSATSSPDERIIAIDIVTHPHAPGIERFERDLMSFLKNSNLTVRHHLGKNFPAGVERYDQFLDANDLAHLKQAIERWHCTPGEHNGAERFAQSPFNNLYMQNMLSPTVSASQLRIAKPLAQLKGEQADSLSRFTLSQHTEFLTKIHTQVSQLPIFDSEGLAAKNAFLNACAEEIDKRLEQLKVPLIS